VEDRSARGADAAGLTTGAPLLLYDGVCGFCAASVRLILRHERRQTLLFAALQSPLGEAVRTRHPELAGVDSMVWVEPAVSDGGERVFVRSDAALRIAAYLGGIWAVVAPARLLPRLFRDRAYDLIARHRHRLSGSRDACVLPSPATRARFLG
jgi:predicted DCC family thiol-disulfide oxidoreductase YuxK